MAAKKKETPKKRIRPVVEVVEDEAEVVEEPTKKDTPVVEAPVQEVEKPTEEKKEEIQEKDTDDKTEDVKENPEPKLEETKPSISTKEHKMSIKSIILIAVVSALVAAFVSGGVYVYLNGVNSINNSSEDVKEEEVETKQTPVSDSQDESSDETEEEPTVEEVDVSEYVLQVLNGSGKPGAAGKGSDVLESGGFVIEDTGNASSFDYEESVVKVKKSVPKAVVSKLVETLETSYKVETSKKYIDEDDDYDIVVTVGTD